MFRKFNLFALLTWTFLEWHLDSEAGAVQASISKKQLQHTSTNSQGVREKGHELLSGVFKAQAVHHSDQTM